MAKWSPEMAAIFRDAVGALREALAEAKTFEDTMDILEDVDLDVLRILEEEFHFLPTPVAGLRERIAHAHLRRLASGELMDTAAVSARTVQSWAESTLEEWLPGYTDYDDRIGGQYKIRLMKDGTYQVETTNGYGARQFHVLVIVLAAT